MIQRELAKDPKLKNENWERFLPNFASKNISKRKQPKNKKVKKPYTPFPPPQPESKVDKMLASGEYFLKDEQRNKKKHEVKEKKQQEANKARQERRNKAFEAPDESKLVKSSNTLKNSTDVNINDLKKNVKKLKMKAKKQSQLLTLQCCFNFKVVQY